MTAAVAEGINAQSAFSVAIMAGSFTSHPHPFPSMAMGVIIHTTNTILLMLLLLLLLLLLVLLLLKNTDSLTPDRGILEDRGPED